MKIGVELAVPLEGALTSYHGVLHGVCNPLWFQNLGLLMSNRKVGVYQ